MNEAGLCRVAGISDDGRERLVCGGRYRGRAGQIGAYLSSVPLGRAIKSAAIALTQAGYAECYNISQGFEGRHDAEHRGSTDGWKARGLLGCRVAHGWKWTYAGNQCPLDTRSRVLRAEVGDPHTRAG